MKIIFNQSIFLYHLIPSALLEFTVQYKMSRVEDSF